MSQPFEKQPHFAQDPNLNHPTPGHYYSSGAGTNLIERRPEFLEYPELRKLPGAPQAEPVFPDEFIGVDSGGDELPNDAMPEVFDPASVLGRDLIVKPGNKFDAFLVELRQRCRNYNLDLYRLRQELYRERIDSLGNATTRITLTAAFNSSAKQLTAWMEAHDPKHAAPKIFKLLAVEFVKVNGYIASIRAAATDETTAAEIIFSSSSHISISSMFSSYSSR